MNTACKTSQGVLAAKAHVEAPDLHEAEAEPDVRLDLGAQEHPPEETVPEHNDEDDHILPPFRIEGIIGANGASEDSLMKSLRGVT